VWTVERDKIHELFVNNLFSPVKTNYFISERLNI
jgi:hypothetical protein